MSETCNWCNGNYYDGYQCPLCTVNVIMDEDEETLRMLAELELIEDSYGDQPSDVSPDTQVEDVVNKPSHYNQYGIECIDAIKAATGDHFEGYLQGNIIKYVWRYRYKNGIEDLQKAQVYTKWLEEHRKEKL